MRELHQEQPKNGRKEWSMGVITKVSTVGMTYEQWVETRNKSIGGSDAAAIVGLNPYSSAYCVWAEKTGRLEAKEDSEAMRQGRDLEQYVAERFAEATGKKVRRCNAIIYNDDYSFAHANIDREIVGEDAGLECKTTSALSRSDFKNGEYPANYYVQCQHYMAITGKKKWYLAVLVLGKGFHIFEIERDEAEIAALMNAELILWQHVTNDTTPDIDGSDATTDALKVIYADEHAGTSVDLCGMEDTLDRIKALGEAVKRLNEEKTACENQIKAVLGENDSGRCGNFSVTYRTQSRSTFDYKRFRADHPGIDTSGYENTTQSRVLRISRKKGA